MEFDDLAKGTRVKEIADELRQWISLDAAIEMLAVYMIAEEVNAQIMDEVQESANKLGVLAKAESQKRTELEGFTGPAIRLVNASLARLVKVRTDLSKTGKVAANALHDQPGGSRERNASICALWASGKYSDRDRCAEEECAALNMSFSAARRALRNTPKPPSRCAV